MIPTCIQYRLSDKCNAGTLKILDDALKCELLTLLITSLNLSTPRGSIGGRGGVLLTPNASIDRVEFTAIKQKMRKSCHHNYHSIEPTVNISLVASL